jgi:hypothetical protein
MEGSRVEFDVSKLGENLEIQLNSSKNHLATFPVKGMNWKKNGTVVVLLPLSRHVFHGVLLGPALPNHSTPYM